MTPWEKVSMATHIWIQAMWVHMHLRTRTLPKIVSGGERGAARFTGGTNPAQLGRIVRRVLTVFGRPPRCLIASLVAYRLLKSQGHPVELVIGLPGQASDKDAHAWLELNGRDIGPPPGRSGHVELARYGGLVDGQ